VRLLSGCSRPALANARKLPKPDFSGKKYILNYHKMIFDAKYSSTIFIILRAPPRQKAMVMIFFAKAETFVDVSIRRGRLFLTDSGPKSDKNLEEWLRFC
jgi:hypothetical protein